MDFSDFIRQMQTAVQKQKTLPEEIFPSASKDDSIEGYAEILDLRNHFFRLKDEERLIISMHIFAGYTSREIAKTLHMNENTVRSKESRALKKLADRLEHP